MSTAPTHWLYPVSRTSGYFVRTGDEDVKVTPEAVWNGVQSERGNSTSWLLSSGFRRMVAGDLIWLYATADYKILCALARSVDVSWSETDGAHRVEMVWDLDVSRELHVDPITRTEFGGQHIQRVRRANPAAVAALDAWLADRRIVPRRPEDPKGPGSEVEAKVWALRQVRQRQGQGGFRDELLKHYKGRCAVTGETCRDVLEAAHIEPFAVSEDHAVSNGILLRSDLHTLFDLHLIGVDQVGALVVSPKVTSPTYQALAGTKLLHPESKPAWPAAFALAEHLDALQR